LGVAFYDVKIEDRRASLVAFLRGLAWMDGVKPAVIRCVRPNAITTVRVLAAMQNRVTRIVGRGDLPLGAVTARVFASLSF
jgi:hypothetical protein